MIYLLIKTPDGSQIWVWESCILAIMASLLLIGMDMFLLKYIAQDIKKMLQNMPSDNTITESSQSIPNGVNPRIKNTQISTAIGLMAIHNNRRSIDSCLILCLFLMLPPGIDHYLKVKWAWWLSLIILVLILVILVDHWILRYRIRKGTYGTTTEDIRKMVIFFRNHSEVAAPILIGGEREPLLNRLRELAPTNLTDIGEAEREPLLNRIRELILAEVPNLQEASIHNQQEL